MTYSKHQWIDDEVIERSEMQNIEDGIDTAHDNIDNHIVDATIHLTSAQNDGLDGANAPGSSNVFATILDIALAINDDAYDESTWNDNTDAASKNAIRDKIVTIDSDINVNTVHKTSDGSDHSFIDQYVTSGASPTLVGTNVTAIPSANLDFQKIGSPTYYTAQHWFDVVQASGIIDGFVITEGDDITHVDISAGKGIIKSSDSELGTTLSFEIDATDELALTPTSVNYIYLDYNAGSPIVVATTNPTSIEYNRMFHIGVVYSNVSEVHILNAGVHVSNLTRTEHERLVERDGFTYISGAVTTNSTLDLITTAGVWYYGHTRLTTDAMDTTGADTFSYIHYGTSSWIIDNAAASIIVTTKYNDGDDVLGNLGVNNYGVQWVYVTADSDYYVIYGTENGTLTAAEAATPPSQSHAYIDALGEVIAKIIVRQTGVIISIQQVHDVRYATATVANHNETGGLQGGAANEYYHLSSAEKTEFDAIDSTYAVLGANSDITSLSGLTTDLSIAQGGTGQSTAQAAIDALSAISGATDEYVLTKDTASGNALWKEAVGGFSDPMTTRGDIIIRNVSNVTDRLGIGANTYVVTSDGTDISWEAPAVTTVKSLFQFEPGAMYEPVTNPAQFIESSGATTKIGWSYRSFDDTTQESAGVRVRMADYDDGNIIIKSSIKLTAPPETSKTVIFDLYTIGIASGENFENAVPTDTTVSITHTITRTELMPNTEDRDFSSASAWANVDINSYDETGDLTITANAADQYVTCPVASIPTTVGNRYILEFDVANIVTTWTIKSFDGTQTIGTVLANGSNTTISFIAETTGGLRIVADTATSSGDFDNFSLYSADLVYEASATIDPANVAVDELMVLELKRDVATDTLVGDAQLTELDIEFTRN